MGKRLITQRRGAASPVHRNPSHRHVSPIKLPKVREPTTAVVEHIRHAPGRSAPLATLRYPDGSKQNFLCAEGTAIGQEVAIQTQDIRPGNVVLLRHIPEATPIHNVESQPGDGGKFVRAAGTTAMVVGRGPRGVQIRLPSGELKRLNPNCRATIGVVAGGGRGEKPLAKAGNAYWKWRSKGKLWPRTGGVKKNPVDHPHGGGNSHLAEGKPTTVKRGTPPGRNVGHLAARRTGKRKG